jgi:hypothetical protein
MPQPEHTPENGEPCTGVEHSVRNQVGPQADTWMGGQQVVPTQQLVQTMPSTNAPRPTPRSSPGPKSLGPMAASTPSWIPIGIPLSLR